MAGPKVLQAGTKLWPEQQVLLTPQQIQKMYENGFAGAYFEPEEVEKAKDYVEDRGGNWDGGDIATSAGFAGSARGQLSIPFIYTIDALGLNPWPGAAQGAGDCVSHGNKNGGLVTYGVEVALSKPDPVTGTIEAFPDISETGILQGAYAPESLWWIRRAEEGGGWGWSCAAGARALCEKIGFWPRMKFDNLNVDLERYSTDNALMFGTKIPQAVIDIGKQHLVRTMTELDGWEEASDFLANGYGVNSCGSQAWSSTRDENGYSPTTSGGWSHSEAYIGADWRPWVQQKYGCDALLCQMNSWGKWNTGPRDIKDSAQFVPASKKDRWIKADLVNPTTGNIMIPHGARWVKCTTLNSRYLVSFASVSGWSARGLPSLGAGGVI